jgi:O-antigen ligase
MHQTVVRIISDYPVFGSGSGTYPIIQHQYKSPLLGNTAMSKRAHNDYLELLCNQGVIGFILLLVPIFILYQHLFKGLKRTRSDLAGIQISCFCSVSAILVHAVADFNFNLPINTVYFFMIIAVALQTKNIRTKKRKYNQESGRS